MSRAYNIDYSGPKRGTAINASSGLARGEGVGKSARDAAAESSMKRSAAILSSSGGGTAARNPRIDGARGSAKDNGVNAISPARTKNAGLGSGTAPSIPERSSPMGGLPGKGGPNRSAGVPRAKAYVKSEGF